MIFQSPDTHGPKGRQTHPPKFLVFRNPLHFSCQRPIVEGVNVSMRILWRRVWNRPTDRWLVISWLLVRRVVDRWRLCRQWVSCALSIISIAVIRYTLTPLRLQMSRHWGGPQTGRLIAENITSNSNSFSIVFWNKRRKIFHLLPFSFGTLSFPILSSRTGPHPEIPSLWKGTGTLEFRLAVLNI